MLLVLKTPPAEASMGLDLVVLDVNETLFGLDPVAERMAQIGLHGHFELWFSRVLRDGIAAAAADRFVSFATLARHHLHLLLEDQGLAEGGEVAVEQVLAGFDELRPHPDVEPGLRVLQASGVPVVALTNGSAARTRALLERGGLDGYLAGVHDAAEVGCWKPNVAAYHRVLERHAARASRSAMVAVHPWDLLGAQRAGLLTGWLNRDGRGDAGPLVHPDVEAADLSALGQLLLARP